jgi:radical SAM superfamily enzyme YgiQ (UPF0313 family)
MRPFLLINANVTRPVVSPVGLEYVAEALKDAGVLIDVLDFAFATDWKTALRKKLLEIEPLAVGMSVRNIDDSSFATRKSFIPWISQLVRETKQLTGAPIILGGGGFSIAPVSTLKATGADAGIEGDGEEAAVLIARPLATAEDMTLVPNLIFWRNSDIIRNPRNDVDTTLLPLPRRRTFDNAAYEQMGAMVGIEAKRGCAQQCIFCADPIAKGKSIRLRPPKIVVQELNDLVDQGISWLHICDSEFNIPQDHAKEICRHIILNKLGDRLRWYCYCSPLPFDRELAQLMIKAGCAGINFGVDSLCDEQLLRLGRKHSCSDISALVDILHNERVNFMFDLLIGGPGETEETAKITIEKVQEMNIPLSGISVGVRVYQGTPLGKAIENGFGINCLHPAIVEPWEPVFYISPFLSTDPAAFIHTLTAKDPRFLFLTAPDDKGSYNYADDEALCQLIEQGNRGAYWDIIRRNSIAS